MPTPAPKEHVLPKGLKKQALLNERRFKILMRDIRNDVVRRTENSANLDEWISKLGGYATTNVFTTGPAAEEASKIVTNIMQAAKYSALPRGSTQELVKGVMSENTMHYVTKMGEDMKTELRKIAVQSYDQKLAPRDVAKEMAKKIDGMTEARARTIARTETMRASNLANYAKAVQMGAQSFTVTSDPNRCPVCGELYGDGTIVFSIDQNDMIPPIHPNCGCIPKYSMKSPEDLGVLDTSEEVAAAALAYHAEIQFDNFSKLWDQVVAETQAYA